MGSQLALTTMNGDGGLIYPFSIIRGKEVFHSHFVLFVALFVRVGDKLGWRLSLPMFTSQLLSLWSVNQKAMISLS